MLGENFSVSLRSIGIVIPFRAVANPQNGLGPAQVGLAIWVSANMEC